MRIHVFDKQVMKLATGIVDLGIEQLKVPSESVRLVRVEVRQRTEFTGGVFTFEQQTTRSWFGWHKDMNFAHPSRVVEFAFPVAAAGGLSDGIEASQGTINDRKVNVHTGLYQLGANHAYWQAFPESPADQANHRRPVLTAHKRGKMDRPCRHELEQVVAVAPGIHDAQHLIVLLESLSE